MSRRVLEGDGELIRREGLSERAERKEGGRKRRPDFKSRLMGVHVQCREHGHFQRVCRNC